MTGIGNTGCAQGADFLRGLGDGFLKRRKVAGPHKGLGSSRVLFSGLRRSKQRTCDRFYGTGKSTDLSRGPGLRNLHLVRAQFSALLPWAVWKGERRDVCKAAGPDLSVHLVPDEQVEEMVMALGTTGSLHRS